MSGRLIGVALVALALAGSADPADSGDDSGRRYLTDAAFRRRTLEESIRHAAATRYAQTRLLRYASGDLDDWERRPEWNPTALSVTAAAATGDRAALRALGEAAFWRYPAQLAPWAKSLPQAEWSTIPVATPDGEATALTCASCHVRRAAEQLTIGAGTALDLGAAMAAGDPAIPAERARTLRQWGPGRVDVSTDSGEDPLRVPDLRAVRWQRYLQYAGAVRKQNLAALAIRIETLIIGAYGGAVRPPRVIALALAVYLDSLGDALPEPITRLVAEKAGEELFLRRCAGCHDGAGQSGGLVPASAFGTDERHARNPERGSGFYRVPSLRGVATRGPLLHDGSGTLDSILRHEPAATRSALRAYLLTL